MDFSFLAWDQVQHFAGLGATFLVSFFLKSITSDLITGMIVKYGDDYEPGDKVYLDGEIGMITSQTWRKTTIQLEGEKGLRVRIVPNSELLKQKIEKVL